MATEYSITYTFEGRSNVQTETGAGPVVDKTSFVLSGDTNKQIGRITKIIYTHYHTSKNGNPYTLKGRMYFADGSYIDSDAIYYDFPWDASGATKFVNTFANDLPSVSLFKTWTQIATVDNNGNIIKNKDLYWRAVHGQALTVEVFFIEAGFMRYGIDDMWKECEVYYGVNGDWQQVTPYYGADGSWNFT